jgi:hypothetical protein
MKNLRWAWSLLLVGALILGSWGCYVMRPARRIDIVVIDKTVPYVNRLEHRSLFWLLRHMKIDRPGGGRYETDRDYLGAFPGPRPGDPPEHTTELTTERAKRADLVYFADTYGVYRDDLLSGPLMKAALERSPKIYGGLEQAEAAAAADSLEAGRTLIVEFNTLASPTESGPRETMENVLGVHWTGWIGRFFTRLDDRGEVPEWMRRDYEREWKKPWEFSGPGYVLMQGDEHCEVLRTGQEVRGVGLRIEKNLPPDPLLEDAWDAVPYPYWFDIVEARPGTKILASYQWHTYPPGDARLEARHLPKRFVAITRRLGVRGGRAYYFAGDFADNPMLDAPVPFAGFPTIRRWMEAGKLYPSESAFYWTFYVPMMTRLLDGIAGEGR